jgi:Mlc titration factor MtfA (ptsG expression regulator)
MKDPRIFDPFRFCPAPKLDERDRRRLIETAAYFLAQKRQFTPGWELADWLAAEALIDLQHDPNGTAHG